MIQELHCAQQHRRRIRDVLADRLGIRVPCTLLKNTNLSNLPFKIGVSQVREILFNINCTLDIILILYKQNQNYIYKNHINQNYIQELFSHYRFKDDTLSAVTGTCDDSGTADQTRREIIHNISVQVRHYHDVELMRIRDHLHGTIVDDHRLERNPILLGNKNIKYTVQSWLEKPSRWKKHGKFRFLLSLTLSNKIYWQKL